MELSILCGCDVALITFSPTGKLHLYSSRSLDQILTRLSEHTSSPFRLLTNADVSPPPHTTTPMRAQVRAGAGNVLPVPPKSAPKPTRGRAGLVTVQHGDS